MNLKDLTPKQREICREVSEHLFYKYSSADPQSFIDVAKAMEFVNFAFQSELAEAEEDARG